MSSDAQVAPTELDDAEVVLARAGVVAGLLALPLLALVVGVWRGAGGLLTALGAAAVVLSLTAASGWALALAARLGPVAVAGVTLGGVTLRLVVYGALLALLSDAPAVDAPALATTVVALTLAVLVGETRAALRHPQLWWVRTDLRPPAAPPTSLPTSTKDRA